MPDFTQLLHKEMDSIKEPEAWPIGLYPGRILRYEPGESGQKKTPQIQFTVGVTGFPDDMEDDVKAGLKLEGKTFRATYYLTEDSLYRLRDLLKSIGLSGYIDEVLPQTIGEDVKIDVTQNLDQQSNKIFNRVDRLIGPNEG